jgi:hypothetical protein
METKDIEELLNKNQKAESDLRKSFVDFGSAILLFTPSILLKAHIIKSVYNMYILESVNYSVSYALVVGIIFLVGLLFPAKADNKNRPAYTIAVNTFSWLMIWGFAGLINLFI